MAKKIFALAKYSWSIYCQWRHSSPTESPKTDGTEEGESQRDASAKSSETRVEGVNGTANQHKSGSELDAGSSKERASSTSGEDGEGTKVKRRRGKWVPEELRASTRQQEEKPYVPPSYYCDDEELNSEEDSETNSDIDEPAELQVEEDSDALVESQKIDHSGELESAKNDLIKEAHETGLTSSNSKDVEDEHVVTVGSNGLSDEGQGVKGTHEDSAVGDSSGVVMVSNSKDGTCTSSLPWTRYQQKQLEWALVQYPKFSQDRWDNIAKAVPGKSKVRVTVRLGQQNVLPS